MPFLISGGIQFKEEVHWPAPEPERVAAWRQRVGADFFFFVGVLRYYKGLDVLLRAVAGTPLRVAIAGDGPERESLAALAEELRLENVTFTGRVADSDKCALFNLARAFVLPSNRRSEAYGVALLEAMRFGLPLVTTEMGTGTSFVNVAGETGFSVAPDDPQALRGTMETLAADDGLCARLGAAGHERLDRVLDARFMIDAYCALYRGLCAGTGGGSRVP